MEVGVGEVNSRGGRAGVQGAMDGGAGIHGAMDGCAGVKKGGCVGCEVKYGWVNWVGNVIWVWGELVDEGWMAWWMMWIMDGVSDVDGVVVVSVLLLFAGLMIYPDK